MRSGLERRLRRLWDGDNGPGEQGLSLLMAPPSWAWGCATAVRNRWHDRRPGTGVEGLRVVSVGNLAVGGTGKTPLAAWVVRRLMEAGARPALLIRGFGADEVGLHQRWNPDIPVIVGGDRVLGARRARAAGATVGVLDDGFQHRRLHRDLDLVLMAVEDAFPGHLLPRGPYREPAAALRRADAVVITRRSRTLEAARALEAELRDGFPGLAVGGLRLDPVGFFDLEGRQTGPVTGASLAASGVARPDDFARMVAQVTRRPVEAAAFGDHHRYTRRDARALRRAAGDSTIVVTEKDAVKLSSFADILGDVRALHVEPVWDWGEDDLRRRLEALA